MIRKWHLILGSICCFVIASIGICIVPVLDAMATSCPMKVPMMARLICSPMHEVAVIGFYISIALMIIAFSLPVAARYLDEIEFKIATRCLEKEGITHG